MSGKASPSILIRLLEELDTYGLSKKKTECIRELVEDELNRRTGENQFREFHKWIKQGDLILTEWERRMDLFDDVTSDDADLISKKAVMEIVNSMLLEVINNDHDKGQNWCAEQIFKQVKALPSV